MPDFYLFFYFPFFYILLLLFLSIFSTSQIFFLTWECTLDMGIFFRRVKKACKDRLLSFYVSFGRVVQWFGWFSDSLGLSSPTEIGLLCRWGLRLEDDRDCSSKKKISISSFQVVACRTQYHDYM